MYFATHEGEPPTGDFHPHTHAHAGRTQPVGARRSQSSRGSPGALCVSGGRSIVYSPNGGPMKIRRIFISLPADQWLTKQENKLKWAIVASVEALGYTAEVFLDPRGTTSLSASLAWSATECERVMRRCEGCVILGFPRWRISSETEHVRLPTDFNQYEGALAHTLGLPLFVLVQQGVVRRVVFDSSYKGYVGIIPEKPSPK